MVTSTLSLSTIPAVVFAYINCPTFPRGEEDSLNPNAIPRMVAPKSMSQLNP